jgi:predicted dehydrogenase
VKSTTLKIGLVGVGRGGPSSYHARSFSSIINGFEKSRVPEDWPVHSKQVEGAEIYAVWDEDQEAARELADVFGIKRVEKKMEDVAGQVDGIIVVDDITMTHQQKALFFIEQGIPTFIDKPLSGDYAEAEHIIERAEAKGTAVMSTSALRYAKEKEEAETAINEIGEVDFALTICQGAYMGAENIIHYGIHPLELAYSVLGPGAVSVQNVGEDDKSVVKIDFSSGCVLSLVVMPNIQQIFLLNLFGREGAVTVTVEDWDYFYWKMLQTYITMVAEKKSPVDLRETLEIIRVLTAAKDSMLQRNTKIVLS